MTRILLAAAAVAALGTAAPASAADFSFTGNLSKDNDVLLFNFTVGSASTVTLLTYSYAGGVNSAGQTIARGGFDPILALYDSGGALIGQNDDGGAAVPADSVTGSHFDTFFQEALNPGTYTVAVTQYDNFGPPNLADPFPHAGDPNFTASFGCGAGSFFDVNCNARDSHWAFDVLNVGSAVVVGVPEPITWSLMIAGFGMAGAGLRRRKTLAAA